MSLLIEINHLSVRYPGARGVSALKDISLKIKNGETMGVVGESGCGKTTLALALMGMLPAGCQSEGEVKINGQTVSLYHRSGKQSARDHCALIFQNPQAALNPVVNVGKQIKRVIKRQAISDTEAVNTRLDELLDKVELPQQCQRLYPHELSGGMQQRIMLAMALAKNADIIIADEPTTALDAGTRLQILNLLDKLQQQQNLAILLISHDLSAIARVCAQMLILYRGRIVEQAPQRLLFSQPRHPYSAGLLAAIPKIHRQRPQHLITLMGEVGESKVTEGCDFAARCKRCQDYCLQQIPPLNCNLEQRQLFACFNPRPLPEQHK